MRSVAVSVVPDATGKGYWVMTSTGNVYAFGDATYYGAPGTPEPHPSPLRWPVVRAGFGYYLLDVDGQVFAYGDALGKAGGLPAGAAGRFGSGQRHFHHRRRQGYWIATALGQVCNPLATPHLRGDMSRNTPQRADRRRDRVLIGVSPIVSSFGPVLTGPVVVQIGRSKSDPEFDQSLTTAITRTAAPIQSRPPARQQNLIRHQATPPSLGAAR